MFLILESIIVRDGAWKTSLFITNRGLELTGWVENIPHHNEWRGWFAVTLDCKQKEYN